MTKIITTALLVLLSACAAPLPVEEEGNATLAQYDESSLEQILVPGQTTYIDVQQRFGQPSSLVQSGRDTFLNYTYRYRDPNLNMSGMESLTIVVDAGGVVTDYDYQHSSFPID